MAQKRNKDEYVTRAEADIDNGWKALPIFKTERSAALLRLVTATDDRIRMTVLKLRRPIETTAFIGSYAAPLAAILFLKSPNHTSRPFHPDRLLGIYQRRCWCAVSLSTRVPFLVYNSVHLFLEGGT